MMDTKCKACGRRHHRRPLSAPRGKRRTMPWRWALVLVISVGLSHSWCALAAPLGPEKPLLLTLDQAIDLALQRNRRVLTAQNTREASRLNLANAESNFDLKLYPSSQSEFSQANDTEFYQLGLGGKLEKRFEWGGQGSLFPEVQYNEAGYGGAIKAAARIPLMRGLGREPTLAPVDDARFGLRSTGRSVDLTRVETVLNTVREGYATIRQQALVELWGASIQRLQKHAATARLQEKVGLASPIDTYRAQIQIKDAQQNLNSSQEALENAFDRFKTVLDIPLHRPVKLDAPTKVQKIAMDPAQAFAVARQHRIEIKQLADRIQDHERRVRIAENNLKPGLDLVLEYSRFSDSDLDEDNPFLNEDAFALRLVSATDWSRRSEKISYKKSRVALRQARLNFDQALNELHSDVRQQLNQLSKAETRIALRQAQIHDAKGKLALAEIKFRNALADNFEVIESETQYQRAQVDLLHAKIDYIVSGYRLQAILGTLLDHQPL